MRDYSGTYTVKLVPCTSPPSLEYTIPPVCNPREPLTFDLDIRFQQVTLLILVRKSCQQNQHWAINGGLIIQAIIFHKITITFKTHVGLCYQLKYVTSATLRKIMFSLTTWMLWELFHNMDEVTYFTWSPNCLFKYKLILYIWKSAYEFLWKLNQNFYLSTPSPSFIISFKPHLLVPFHSFVFLPLLTTPSWFTWAS